MRKRLLFLFLTLGCLTGLAQSKNDVVVWKKDGSSFICALADRPKITYASSYYTITTNESKTELLFTDVWKITFYEDESSSVKSELANKPSISIAGDNIEVKDAGTGETISLYSVSGSLLMQVKTDNSGMATLSISSFPKGIYIIHSKITSLKITKK